MVASLLNDTMHQFDGSGSYLRLKELAWEAGNDPDFDIEREGFTGTSMHDVMEGLSVALYVIEGQIDKAYALDVWWLQQHCEIALDILDAINLWVLEGHYIPSSMLAVLRQDYQAMGQRVDRRSQLVGVHTLGDELRMQHSSRGILN